MMRCLMHGCGALRHRSIHCVTAVTAVLVTLEGIAALAEAAGSRGADALA